MAFLTGKPTKAFITQDHDAHIATHMAMMQDPSVMQLIGQSPMAQQMQGAIMAHIAQHLAFNYRAKVEQQLGVPLPPPDSELNPQVEIQISRLVAQASQQLLQTLFLTQPQLQELYQQQTLLLLVFQVLLEQSRLSQLQQMQQTLLQHHQSQLHHTQYFHNLNTNRKPPAIGWGLFELNG
jgi:hypothetical protein